MLSIVCPFVFGDTLPGVGTITAVRAVRLAELSHEEAARVMGGDWFKFDWGLGDVHGGSVIDHWLKRRWQTDFPGHPWETTWCWWTEVSNTKGPNA